MSGCFDKTANCRGQGVFFHKLQIKKKKNPAKQTEAVQFWSLKNRPNPARIHETSVNFESAKGPLKRGWGQVLGHVEPTAIFIQEGMDVGFPNFH